MIYRSKVIKVPTFRSNRFPAYRLRAASVYMVDRFNRPAWHRRPGNVRTTAESEIDIACRWLFARAALRALTLKRGDRRLYFQTFFVHPFPTQLLQIKPLSFGYSSSSSCLSAQTRYLNPRGHSQKQLRTTAVVTSTSEIDSPAILSRCDIRLAYWRNFSQPHESNSESLDRLPDIVLLTRPRRAAIPLR